MPNIVSSTYTEGPPQIDGRRYITERHVDDAGQDYTYEWLGSQSAQAVLDARRALLDRKLAERAEAEALVAGTRLPLTKLQFRELFTVAERQAVDEFNETFEAHPALTAEQKRLVRTGLEDYRTASNIRVPLDGRVAQMVGLYQTLGILSAERAAAILAA